MENQINTKTDFKVKLDSFLKAIGLEEEPMGIFYTDEKPVEGYTPKKQTPLSKLYENHNEEVSWISCILAKIKIARLKNSTAYFDESHYGCLGGAFFTGLKKTYEEFEIDLISKGIPGKMEGERYVDSRETGRKFYDAFEPPLATAKYLVVKPLSHFKSEQKPELVVFFVKNEILVGLNALTVFLTSDMNSVQTPFGVGCCSLISWPRKFLQQGKNKAVIGCCDVTCRKYLKKDELTFTVPYNLFLRMLTEWENSIINTSWWEKTRKRR